MTAVWVSADSTVATRGEVAKAVVQEAPATSGKRTGSNGTLCVL